MRYIIFLSLFICFVLYLGCKNIPDEAEQKYHPRDLKSVEFQESFELKDKPYTKEFIYHCHKRSSKFLFRLYYDNIEFENSLKVKDDADNKILNSLVGFSFRFYEVKTNKKIAEYTIKDTSYRDRHIFVLNDPFLSFWLESQIKVNRNHNYRIIISIPSKKDTDVKFLKPILVGGISKDAFF